MAPGQGGHWYWGTCSCVPMVLGHLQLCATGTGALGAVCHWYWDTCSCVPLVLGHLQLCATLTGDTCSCVQLLNTQHHCYKFPHHSGLRLFREQLLPLLYASRLQNHPTASLKLKEINWQSGFMIPQIVARKTAPDALWDHQIGVRATKIFN